MSQWTSIFAGYSLGYPGEVISPFRPVSVPPGTVNKENNKQFSLYLMWQKSYMNITECLTLLDVFL